MNSKVDALIRDIADSYLDNVGWADALDSLQVLEKTPPRVNNQKEFTGMEWVGAHLLSVLRDKVEEQALKEGRCGNDGHELERREIKQTRDSPGYEYLICPMCLEEWPVQD